MATTKVFDRRTLGPGQTLIREGDMGDAAFFIQSGLFEVVKHDRDHEMLLAQLGKNSIVGEMSLIDNSRRSATVRCVTEGTVLVLDRASFDERLKHLDKFTRALLEMFSNKLRMLNEECLNKSRKTAVNHYSANNETSRDSSGGTAFNELMAAWVKATPNERQSFWRTVIETELPD
ncbi:MAG: cyclic nucleotide-binding domain-containing protein [Rhodospirillaceae bacterium]